MKFINTLERKMIALYVMTTVVMYGSFWVGWYFLGIGGTLGLAFGMVFAFGLIFAVFKKTVWAPMIFVVGVATAMGLLFSCFFLTMGIVPSRFWGLCLLIMLAYKALQAYLGEVIKNRKKYYSFFVSCMVLEAIAAFTVAVAAGENGSLLWQVFFALLVCFFYSCGQLALKKSEENNFWRQAAKTYLLGFVFIFVLLFLIVLSVLSEDGGAFEFLFESAGESVGDAASERWRKRKDIDL